MVQYVTHLGRFRSFKWHRPTFEKCTNLSSRRWCISSSLADCCAPPSMLDIISAEPLPLIEKPVTYM